MNYNHQVKSIIATLFLSFALALSSQAQNNSGEVHYVSNATGDSSKDFSQAEKDRQNERLKKIHYKELVLKFTNTESYYKEKESLKVTENSAYRAGFLAASGAYSSAGIYKNLKTKQFTEEREFYGKIFLVKDSLPLLDWKLEKESKQIGEYTVYKATLEKKIDVGDVTMPSSIGERKAASVIVTAWYTPQIPISLGPGMYQGLPGLILELNVHQTTILCEKVIIRPNSNLKVKASKRGEEVSLIEFDEIAVAKREEQQTLFKN